MVSQNSYIWLQAEVKWISKSVNMFGKEIMEPRQVAYMADNPSLSYTYSKTKMKPAHWHPEVEYLKVCHCDSVREASIVCQYF